MSEALSCALLMLYAAALSAHPPTSLTVFQPACFIFTHLLFGCTCKYYYYLVSIMKAAVYKSYGGPEVVHVQVLWIRSFQSTCPFARA